MTTKILALLRKIKDVAFATVDEQGFPKNRIIDVMSVEDGRLFFCTARGKDFYRELIANGKVAITGLDKDTWQMVRLSGSAKRLDKQREWIDRIFEENPSMNDVYPDGSRYILEAFCVEQGTLEWFDLGSSPIHRQNFALGGGAVSERGFLITENCIGCGVCKQGCPQQCIKAGTPYQIEQTHCLHCGLCAERCPVDSVVRRQRYDT